MGVLHVGIAKLVLDIRSNGSELAARGFGKEVVHYVIKLLLN